MKILKNVNQLNSFLAEYFLPSEEIKQQILLGNFVNKFWDDESTNLLASCIESKIKTFEQTSALCEMLFQLNNYLPLLCNLTNVFLKAKKYDAIHLMVSKIFVAHVGTKVYHSSTPCSFAERNFDRFIEIIKNCEIKEDIYMPFLVEIFKSDISGSYGEWKRPALEYLQNFWNANESRMLEFVEKNPAYRYGVLDTILQFNTNKGIELLMENYINNSETDLEQVLNLVKLYKREVLFYIDCEILKTSSERQAKLVELLLNLDGDTEIMARVNEILSTTDNAKIKNIIFNKMGISETLNIRTEKQFLNAVRKSELVLQERVLGVVFDKFDLKFKSGYPADNAVYTFLFYLFKEEKTLLNLKKLRVILKIFEPESLQKMLNIIYDVVFSKSDIKEFKWALRMLALLGNQNIDNKIYDFIIHLCKSERQKEAKYLILCMIYSEKTEIILIIKRLLEINNKFIQENLNYLTALISETSKIEIEDLKDILVLNNYDNVEFEQQRQRLFEAFIAAKQYSAETFKKLFIENMLFNQLAQNLIFGEYRSGRLYNAFIVKNKEIEFLIGKTIFEENVEENDEAKSDILNKNFDIYISLIHPLDCDFKFEKIYNYFKNPPFDQFKKPRFNCKDCNNSSTIVNRFVGIFVNPQKFIDHILNFGFVINKDESETKFKSFVHIFPCLNIICELEFEQFVTEKSLYASLGNVCFYKLSETFKVGTKYITQKSSSLNISALPYRYYDFMLSEILEASKHK